MWSRALSSRPNNSITALGSRGSGSGDDDNEDQLHLSIGASIGSVDTYFSTQLHRSGRSWCFIDIDHRWPNLLGDCWREATKFIVEATTLELCRWEAEELNCARMTGNRGIWRYPFPRSSSMLCPPPPPSCHLIVPPPPRPSPSSASPPTPPL
jgi:hypothetical protein